MKLGAKCKYCRKFGHKIGLNERCLSHKCALIRRRTKPGAHGRKAKILSLFSKQLIEKQRLKISYLLTEKKLKKYVALAIKSKKSALEALLEILERRLDNVIWRASYVPSKTTARQLIAHGHFLVNEKKIKVASYLVKEGDLISLRPSSRKLKVFQNLNERLKFYNLPSWLSLDQDFNLKIIRLPQASEIQHNFNLSLVIDFYSRQ